MNLFVTVAAMALGIFVMSSPARAANIWGAKRLEDLPPKRRVTYLRLYRVLGVSLCLASVMLAIESLASNAAR